MDYHSAEVLDVADSKRVTQYRLPDLIAAPSREIAFRQRTVIACFHSVCASLRRKHVSKHRPILLKLSIINISTSAKYLNMLPPERPEYSLKRAKIVGGRPDST
jgi:hypothetical protein